MRKLANKGGSRHMKVSNIPGSWPRGEKSIRFLPKPTPGPHSIRFSLPLVIVIRDLLGLASTAREARLIISGGHVKVNKRVRREEKFPVGPFDVLEVDQQGSFCVLPKLGVGLYPVPYQGPRYLRVEGKLVKGNKYQLVFHDGSNILVEKSGPFAGAKVGSSVKFEYEGGKWVPKQELPLAEGSLVVVVGGRNEGVTGKVASVAEELVNITTPDGRGFQTSRDHVYVVDESLTSVIVGSEASAK